MGEFVPCDHTAEHNGNMIVLSHHISGGQFVTSLPVSMETLLESGIFSEEYMNNYEYGEVPFKGCSSKGVIPNNF